MTHSMASGFACSLSLDGAITRADAAEARVAELKADLAVWRSAAVGKTVVAALTTWRGKCGHDWRKDQSEDCPVCRAEALEARVVELENLEADFKTLSKMTIAELFLCGMSLERAEATEAKLDALGKEDCAHG